jgi:tetratricopeptide (TPR) repeat protein
MGQVLIAFLLLLPVGFHQSAELTERFRKAAELQRQGALEQAAAEYRAVLKVKPDYLEVQANLGVVLAQMGRFDEAITAYEAALKLAPNFLPLKQNMGIAYYRAGRFEKAVPIFEQVLSSAPDSLQARQLLGLSLVELGRDADALPHLQRTLSMAPDDPAVLYSLGLAYLRLGKPEMRDIVNRLPELANGLAAAYLLKGQALLASFEFERAIPELEMARKLNPALPRLDYSLGLGYLKLGRNQEAIQCFERELARTPRDFSTLYYLAYLHEADGNFSAALARLDAGLNLEPQSTEGNALLGKILFKQGKAAEALLPLKKAVEQDPQDPDKRFMLARVYQQLGKGEDAAREFAEVQRLKVEKLNTDRARTPKP